MPCRKSAQIVAILSMKNFCFRLQMLHIQLFFLLVFADINSFTCGFLCRQKIEAVLPSLKLIVSDQKLKTILKVSIPE